MSDVTTSDERYGGRGGRLRAEPLTERLAAAFDAEAAVQAGATRRLATAQITLARAASAEGGAMSPLAPENAFLAVIQLAPAAGFELSRGGERVFAGPLPSGAVAIAHLGDEPALHFAGPFDCVLAHVPQMVLGELAERHGAPTADALACIPGDADPAVADLARAALPSLCGGGDAWLDPVAVALVARLAARFGRAESAAPQGLTPWQTRTAKAALGADLAQEPRLVDIARACGLPLHRFLRGFRQATGAPPHRWLRQLRVERAKELMLGSHLGLSQIAYECGFADQSHFTRVFAAAVGLPPGAWRRARGVA